MNLPLLSTYSLAVLLLIITPGPVVALVTRVAAHSGSRHAFATVIGSNAASLVLMAMAILMLSGLMALSALSLALLGLPGSIYLAYLALQGIRAPANGSQPQPVTAERHGLLGGFMTGLSNPKDMLFFAAFFPQFIAVTDHVSASVLVLALIWVLLDFAVLSCYILAITRWFRARHQRVITLLSSWTLLVIAGTGGIYNAWVMTEAVFH